MTLGPPVRPLALSVFAFINILFGWLWWQAVQVEKHHLPDLCSYPYISGPLHTSSPAGIDQAGDASRAEDPSFANDFGSCFITTSALWQRRQWNSRGEQQPINDTLSGSCQSASIPLEELSQWTTLLHVVPLCPDAEPAAHWVYRYFAAIGGADMPGTIRAGHCTTVPVLSVMAAAGQETGSGSGSSNALLAVHLSSSAQNSASFIYLPAELGRDAAAAAPSEAFGNAHAEPTAGGPQALVTLRLFISSPQGKADDIRLHIGAGSSMLLVVPRELDTERDLLTTKTAAEAVVQALGRWVLSPAAASSPAVADWSVRLWLLGDGDDTATVGGNSRRSALQVHATSESPADQAAIPMSWEADEVLRTNLRGFFGVLSGLVDLSFTSRVRGHLST